MGEVAIVQPRSVTADMASRFGMEVGAFEATMRATVIPGNVSREQFAAFLLVAKQYGLNPLTREIFAFPAKGGGIFPVVSVDGWSRIINEQREMNGLTFEDHRDESGDITAITAKIYRKDRDHPVTVTEYMNECRRDTDTWRKWPARMLRHKATIQAARYAFGFAGIYDIDEAERMPEGGGLGGADNGVVEQHDEVVGFIGGHLAELLTTDLQSRIDGAATKEELAKIEASFRRMYYNQREKRVSDNLFSGWAEMFAKREEALDEAEFRDYQRTHDITAAVAADK